MSLFHAQRFRILISLTRILIQAHDSAATQTPPSSAAPHSSRRQLITIPLPDRTLEAVFTTPTTPSAAVLLFHGIGDQLIYWQSAQALLAEHNIASLLFHYSGYGKSTGATTPKNLREDAQAAYTTLRSLLQEPAPIHLLGFSLGSGIATDAAPYLTPPPASLILCQAFTSLRLAARSFAPAALCPLLPDIYQTHRTIADISLPLLIVHSDADRLFPVSMAQQLHASAKTRSCHPVEIVHPTGFSHNDIYLNPALAYWQPILNFILHSSSSQSTR